MYIFVFIQHIQDAIENNKEIPTDLRKEALALSRDSTWGEGISTVDDEYRWAGCEDPKIVITTSRNPSAKLKMFAKVFSKREKIDVGAVVDQGAPQGQNRKSF